MLGFLCPLVGLCRRPGEWGCLHFTFQKWVHIQKCDWVQTVKCVRRMFTLIHFYTHIEHQKARERSILICNIVVSDYIPDLSNCLSETYHIPIALDRLGFNHHTSVSISVYLTNKHICAGQLGQCPPWGNPWSGNDGNFVSSNMQLTLDRRSSTSQSPRKGESMEGHRGGLYGHA